MLLSHGVNKDFDNLRRPFRYRYTPVRPERRRYAAAPQVPIQSEGQNQGEREPLVRLTYRTISSDISSTNSEPAKAPLNLHAAHCIVYIPSRNSFSLFFRASCTCLRRGAAVGALEDQYVNKPNMLRDFYGFHPSPFNAVSKPVRPRFPTQFVSISLTERNASQLF